VGFTARSRKEGQSGWALVSLIEVDTMG